jgi:hypothetical protein
MDLGTLDSFEAELRHANPSFEVRFKDESWLQRVLGFLLYPFNPKFLTDYTTTYGSHVYFPSRAYYVKDPERSVTILAHEFVHIYDSERDALFRVKYMLPQGFVLLPLILYGLLAWSHAWILAVPLLGYCLGAALVHKSRAAFWALTIAGLLALAILGWAYTGWKLLAMAGLLFVGPWPSPWRREYELRGYGMKVAIRQWCHGKPSKEYMDIVAGNFTGSGYLYMCRDRAYIERSLEATRQQAETGRLQGIYPYSLVYVFLSTHQMTRVKTLA